MATPALLTRISTPPNSTSANANKRCTSSEFETSTGVPQILPVPERSRSVTTLATAADERPQIATDTPSRRRRAVIARPMPLVPPVTTSCLLYTSDAADDLTRVDL